MHPFCSPRLALLTAALLGPIAAQAALLSHDSFSDYTIGELPTSPAPVIAGYTGDWADVDFGGQQASVTAGSLSYGDILYAGASGDRVTIPFNTTGGEINAANSGRTFRLLDSTLAATDLTVGSLYLSFLFQSGQETGATTYQTLHLNNDNGDANRNFDIGLTNNSGPGTSYSFGVDDAYTSTGVTANTAVHLFVVKFSLSTVSLGDSVTVWVDPTLGAGEPVGGVTASGVDLTWDRLNFSDYDGNSAAWDELRWGDAFDSVTVVPEPSSALLAALGVVGLLVRRRRN